nr:MAG TPA: hypothetical protein [Caudoviricetes sp.]
MKYDVTYTCGHIATIQLYGKTSEREERIKWLEDNCVCPECYKAQKEAERKAENEKAAEAAKNRGTQELSGSSKQIAWANTIREKALKYIDEKMNLEDERVKKLIEYINNSTITKSASWWIDRRNCGEVEILREIAKATMSE